MSAESRLLDGAWRLGGVPSRGPAFDDDDRAAVTRWLPARVPGTLHADLVAAGALAPLESRSAIRAARWVERHDWWLEREIEVDGAPGERLFLHLDGLDYLATLWLDDRRLGRHESPIARRTVELTAHARPGPRRLGIRLRGVASWPAPRWGLAARLAAPVTRLILGRDSGLSPFHPRLGWIRPPMQAGWDFAPRLHAIGLWGGVTLERTGPVRIVAARVGPWRWAGSTARGAITIELDAARATRVETVVGWSLVDGTARGEAGAARILPSGRATIDLPLEIPDARRWRPWELGAPHRYRLDLSVSVDGTRSAATSMVVGIREIGWTAMRAAVEGEPFFVRGVNWVPADLLPGRAPRSRYRALLEGARERGVNLLRVWGGGGREQRHLYELCDELGLLIWQEFPFACAFVDHYPHDPAWRARALDACRGMVRDLRHHPSIALWGAGNEFSSRRNRALVDGLARLVRDEDDRAFVGPSPGRDDRHAWEVWHGLAPLTDLAGIEEPMLSEFGLQALPSRASMARLYSPDRRLDPDAWRDRHGDPVRLAAYVAPAHVGSLGGWVAASQAAQADGVQVAVEAMRRREGAGGVAVWQWNEPWPAICWALIEHDGTPKAAGEWLATWYHPRLLSLDFDRRRRWRAGERLEGELWAINDLPEPLEGAEARLSQAGMTLWEAPVRMAPRSAARVAGLAIRLVDTTPLELELWHAGRLVRRNRYTLALPGPSRMPWRLRIRRAIAELTMRL